MRRFLITLAIIVLSSSAFAEDIGATSKSPVRDDAPGTEKPQLRPRSYGWYVAPTLGVTTISNEATFEAGVRAAFRFERRFGVGLAGYGWSTDPDGHDFHGGFGGAMFEYVFAPEAPLHLATATVLGGGAYCGQQSVDDDCHELYGFFASDSTLNLELTVAEQVRVSLGGGFRFALTGDSGPLASSDLRGFVARTSVQLGEL